MSDLVISGNTSGTVTLRAPDVAGSVVVTLPSSSLTLSSGGETVALFTSSTTWAVPAGVTSATFIVIGGGGGGSGTNSATNVSAQNGGRGGCAIASCTGLLGSVTITVGSGGTGGDNGSGSTGTGTAGGASSASGTGVSVTATGGAGGAYNAGGTAANGTGSVSTGVALLLSDIASASPYFITGSSSFDSGVGDVTNPFRSPQTWTVASGYRPGAGGVGRGNATVAAAKEGDGGYSGLVAVIY